MKRKPRLTGPTVSILEQIALTSGREVHGYELMKSTGLRAGTLYPALARLRDNGLLDSRSEPSPVAPGRSRVYYRLTDFGSQVVRELSTSGVTASVVRVVPNGLIPT